MESDASASDTELVITTPNDHQDFYKTPTLNEMQELNQTMELFKSNLFKLQMDELLDQVKLKKMTPIEKLLFEIKSALDTSKDWDALSFDAARDRLLDHEIQLPFPNHYISKDINYTLGYSKPFVCNVVGSFLLETMAKNPTNIHADLAIQMPQSMFQEKDYTNYRYSIKRSHYLAAVACILKNEIKDIKLEFEAFHGDLRRCVLIVSKDNGFVRIFPCIAPNYFNLNRLLPERNNVRCASHPPTPYYNSLILFDTCLVSHLNFLHHHASNTKHFRDAVILGKIWIHQRFPYARGFNGFLFSMIMGYLLQSNDEHGVKRLSCDFSCYQLFKITLHFIASHDFKANPIFMNVPDVADFSKESFTKHYDVVIVDPSGRVNLGSCMSKCQLDELQYEAQLALELLSKDSQNAFDGLFLRQVHSNALKFDHFARISGNTISLAAYSEAAKVDYPSARIFALHYIPKVFKKALKERVRLISMNSQVIPCWSIDSETPKDTNLDIYLGFILNNEFAFNPIEFGPSPDDKNASDDFKRLWGETAEVRRYQDGSIKESVVIPYKEGQDKGLIMQKLNYILLKRHMGITLEEGVHYFSSSLTKLLKAPGIQQEASSFKSVNDAFVELSKQLKSLKDLPLSIVNVNASHPGLYQASVFVPQPQPSELEFADGYRPFLEYMDVVIEFETSGYWPDNLAKLQQMKSAFYLEIAKQLKTLYPGSRTQVNIGNRTHVMESGFLDLVSSSGYKFRLRIHVEREKYLMEYLDKSKIAKAWSFYNTVYVKRPLHASHMQNICFTYPFLSDTIRLCKRWFSAHLLSGHISDEWIETCCVSVFRNSSPWSSPSSSLNGFIRVLYLFSQFEWKSEPLIVEMETGRMTSDVKTQIMNNFKQQKKSTFVATEYDLDSSFWPCMDRVILQRVRTLSKSCLQVISQKMMHAESKWIKALFSTCLSGYNSILKLDASKCSRFRENMTFDPSLLTIAKPKYRNLISPQDRESALLSRIDTVSCLVEDLKASFSDVGYFFYDQYGGDLIAIVWKIKNESSPWKVNLKCNVIPLGPNADQEGSVKKKRKGNEMISPHYEAMLSEMQRIGHGLVVGIQHHLN